jgi:hypothetical protein
VTNIKTDAGATIAFATNKYLVVYPANATSFVNSGAITVQGNGWVYLPTVASVSYALGNINGHLRIYLNSGSASSTFTLLGNETNLPSVTIDSADSTHTLTFDVAGKSISTSGGITAGTRGIVLSSVAGAKVKVGTGGITVAANGQLDETNIEVIENGGNTDLSAGTHIQGTTKWILTGFGKTLKLAAAQKLYDLITTAEAYITLAANATVSNEIVKAADNIALGGFTLTHESPDKFYDCHRIHHESPATGPLTKLEPGDLILDHLADPLAMEMEGVA